MQTNPRRMKIIALVIALFFCAVALLDTFVRENFGSRSTPIDSDSLAILKAILIFMSAYGFAAVVALQFWRAKLLDQLSTRRSRFSPEARFLVINYPWLVAPALYGQLLYNCGIPLREFFYFLGAAIVTTLTWAIFEFRKT